MKYEIIKHIKDEFGQWRETEIFPKKFNNAKDVMIQRIVLDIAEQENPKVLWTIRKGSEMWCHEEDLMDSFVSGTFNLPALMTTVYEKLQEDYAWQKSAAMLGILEYSTRDLFRIY